MSPVSRPRLVARRAILPLRGLLAVALAAGSTAAHAATYDVGASQTYTTLRAAIDALNSAGADVAGDEIVIHSAEYSNTGDWGANSFSCSNTALPMIQVPVTIRSTGGAATTAPIPPIASQRAIELQGLTIHGGEGSFPWGGTGCMGPIWMDDGAVAGTDLVLEPGPLYGGGPGLQARHSDVELEDVTIRGFTDSSAAELETFFGESMASFTNVRVEGNLEGIRLFNIAEAAFDGVNISGQQGTGLQIEFGLVTITDSVFEGNGRSAIRSGAHTLDIVNTEFRGNQASNGGAIEAWNGHVLVSGSQFVSNRAKVGGAIYYEADGARGRVTLRDTTFDGNYADGEGGAIAMAGRLDAEGITVIGGEGGGASAGAGIYLYGDGTIRRSTFSDLFSEIGGALVVERDEDYDFAGLRLEEVEFSSVDAMAGGAVFAWAGTYVDGEGVTVRGAEAADVGGAFAFIGESIEWEYPVAGVGVLSTIRELVVEGAAAATGGVFALLGPGHDLTIEGGRIDGAEASSMGEFFGGYGGVLMVEDGSQVAMRGVEIDAPYAAIVGAVVASGSIGDIRKSQRAEARTERAAVGGSYCDGLYADPYRLGSEFWFEGVTVVDPVAGVMPFGAFSEQDAVRIHGSEIRGARVEPMIVPLGGEGGIALPDAVMGSFNARLFEVSCTEVCGSESGTVALHLDSYYPWDRGGVRTHLQYENNVFENNAVDVGVIAVDVCTEDGPIWTRTGVEPQAVGVDTAWVDTAFDSADTGLAPSTPRGDLVIRFNTFVGNTGTLISGATNDLVTAVSSNVFDGGDVGLSLWDADHLRGDYNLFNGLGTDATEDAAAVFPGPNAQTGAPAYSDYTADSCDNELWLTGTSPGVDGADPEFTDAWNGSRADIGAYGGPNACFPDADGDTHIAVVDCDDSDLETFPGANETPYDGVDQDCDGEDLCDVDEDGFLSDHVNCGGDDCDDARPDVNPDATDIAYDGVDQDCDGQDACDADGDGVNALACGGIDCNDENDAIYPGAPETAGDSVDSNCDGEDDPAQERCDDDLDGVIALACDGIDCDDTDADIHPGAVEIPYDGIDQDCDGADLCDVDGDGFDAANEACGGDDCDDEAATVYPGAGEIPDDGIDQDCDTADATIYVQGGPAGCNCSAVAGGLPTGMGLAWLGLMGLGITIRRRR